MSSAGPLLVAAALGLGMVTAPVSAVAAEPATKKIVSTHLSASGFDQRMPRGAVVSVVQTCPAGELLDKAQTRARNRELDRQNTAEPNVRLASRELWVAGLVTRFRVVRAGGVPTKDGFGLATFAICTRRVPANAKTVTQRASTDVRVWGPAPSGVRLYSFTGVFVSDGSVFRGRQPFVSTVRATGVTPSCGALHGGVRAKIRRLEGGLFLVQGRTRRSIPRGHFSSMRSTYTVTTDLTRRMADPETSGRGSGEGPPATGSRPAKP